MKNEFLKQINTYFPSVDYCSFRFVNKYTNIVSVTRNVLEPIEILEDEGVMATIIHNGGYGYGASSDLTPDGILKAIEEAKKWAEYSSGKLVHVPHPPSMRTDDGKYFTHEKDSWAKESNKDKVDYLMQINKSLKSKPTISNWGASFRYNKIETLFTDTNGSDIRQNISYILPQLVACAEYKKQIQTRTFGGHAHARQIGYNFLRDSDLIAKAEQIANDAIELSMAPNCPDSKMDALIAPDQMILQIHESIGHPLELDRILGDERNYAGSSFVNLDMFGEYKYGSDKLNISFNPNQESELATYNYDDDGTAATKKYLIKDGILERPIGGFYSSQRVNQDYVACSRATSWNRPPIDRMGNINLEPGESSFSEMIASVEDGILLETNNSWSIDDYRNKFQFGCEKGTIIKNGELKSVTKNPNYRGITKEFWHNLSMVGDETSFSILGTANCGKGEPNQTIFVGHATPPCLFREIDIFGGE
ncbi:MAG: TldD/PmbA family protein [Pseudomonadota bacterium]|nr:TldD/PmbA family protein [Pseudomonadota bacterium]